MAGTGEVRAPHGRTPLCGSSVAPLSDRRPGAGIYTLLFLLVLLADSSLRLRGRLSGGAVSATGLGAGGSAVSHRRRGPGGAAAGPEGRLIAAVEEAGAWAWSEHEQVARQPGSADRGDLSRVFSASLEFSLWVSCRSVGGDGAARGVRSYARAGFIRASRSRLYAAPVIAAGSPIRQRPTKRVRASPPIVWHRPMISYTRLRTRGTAR